MKNKLMWFANDADGLSMVDILTIFISLLFFVLKIVQIILAIYIPNVTKVELVNTSISTLDDMMAMVLSYYFIKKGIDTTVSKICLTKENKYKELYNDMRSDSSNNTTNTNS